MTNTKCHRDPDGENVKARITRARSTKTTKTVASAPEPETPTTTNERASHSRHSEFEYAHYSDYILSTTIDLQGTVNETPMCSHQSMRLWYQETRRGRASDEDDADKTSCKLQDKLQAARRLCRYVRAIASERG